MTVSAVVCKCRTDFARDLLSRVSWSLKSVPSILSPPSFSFFPGSFVARAGLVVMYAVFCSLSSSPIWLSLCSRSRNICMMLLGWGLMRSKSSTKTKCDKWSWPIGTLYEFSSHFVARGSMIQFRVLTKSKPDSGEPCLAPRASAIGFGLVMPYRWGVMCVPMSSLERFSVSCVGRPLSVNICMIELCFMRSNALERSSLMIVSGCSHSCANSVSLCSVK